MGSKRRDRLSPGVLAGEVHFGLKGYPGEYRLRPGLGCVVEASVPGATGPDAWVEVTHYEGVAWSYGRLFKVLEPLPTTEAQAQPLFLEPGAQGGW